VSRLQADFDDRLIHFTYSYDGDAPIVARLLSRRKSPIKPDQAPVTGCIPAEARAIQEKSDREK